MKKRIVAVSLLAMLLLSVVLGGCGKKEEQKPAGNGNGDTSQEGAGKEEAGKEEAGKEEAGNGENGTKLKLPLSEEKATLSLWIPWYSEFLDSIDEIEAVRQMEENTNVHIDFVSVSPNEATEKYGLMLASGDYPDILFQSVVSYPGGLEKGVEEGILVDITGLIENYMPNYRSLYESDASIQAAITTDSGKKIGVYSMLCNNGGVAPERSWGGIAVRKDWLDQVGLDLPVTIDDWTEVLMAFKNQIGCESPLSIGNTGSIGSKGFLTAYDVIDDYYLDGNEIKFGPAEQGYADYLDQMAEWYAAGLIDPNFISDYSAAWTADAEMVVNGRCGVFHTINSYLYDGYKTLGYELPEGFDVVPVQAPVLKEGDPVRQYSLMGDIVNNSHAVVTTNCKNPELAVKWLDYQFTTEGMLLNNYGIQDKTYTANGQDYRYTDYVLNNPDYSSTDVKKMETIMGGMNGITFGFYNWETVSQTLNEQINAGIDIWNADGTAMKIPTYISMTDEEGNDFNLKNTVVQTMAQEKAIAVILGNDTTENYDAFVQSMMSAGLEDCLKYKQAAYDRYLAR